MHGQYKVNKSQRFSTILITGVLLALMISCKSGRNVNVTLKSDGSVDVNVSAKGKSKGNKPTNTPPKGGSTNPPKSDPPKDPKPGQASAKAEQVIKTARTYQGAPYKMGGSTKSGMDCSGLMLVSFRSAGVELPRTSKEQSLKGKDVALTALQPGDMVFFTDKKGNTTVTHVGMVTIVNGPKDVKFIHASTHLGVVETDLFTTYYTPLILRARRVW